MLVEGVVEEGRGKWRENEWWREVMGKSDGKLRDSYIISETKDDLMNSECWRQHFGIIN